MLISFKRGQGSIIVRVKIRNSAVATGAGLTGLTHASAGLIISTIADNEATPTAYTQGGSTIETITTLGTYAAPTATKCRFKEVDATNHKGVYEIQIADARFAVSSAKSLLISIAGASGAAECDAVIPLTEIDPYSIAHGLAELGIVYGTADTGATTTSIPTSAIAPAAAVTDQFKGRIIVFLSNTTTANLRGQASDITASTSGGTLTVSALSTAPVSGDKFVIM